MQPRARTSRRERQAQRLVQPFFAQPGLDRRQKRLQPLARQRRDRLHIRPARILHQKRLAGRGAERVDLVPDLDQRDILIHTKGFEDVAHIGGLLLGFGMRNIAHMQDQIGLEHLFERRAESRDQLMRQVRDEPHRVRHDHLAPRRQRDPAHRWVERRKQHVLGHHRGPGHAVEQRGFARVRIAHQRDDRERHLTARGAVQLAGLDDFGQLPTQAHHLFVDGAAVGLDLGFAGAAHEAKPAALTFKVGPGADQPRALIGERRQLDLKHALAGARAVGEDLKDQPGPVEELHAPFLFEIALLNGRHRPVDQHQVDLLGVEPLLQFGELARPEQMPRMGLGQAHDLSAQNLKPRQCQRERHCLGQGMFRQTPRARRRADLGVDHEGTCRPRLGRDQVAQSSPS